MSRFFVFGLCFIPIVCLFIACGGGGSDDSKKNPDTDTNPGTNTEDNLGNVTFVESNAIFANPERGFHQYTQYGSIDSSTFSGLRNDGVSLIWYGVNGNAFMSTDFDTAFLNQISSDLALIRTNGCKAIFRLSYSDTWPVVGQTEPAQAQLIAHINQLKPIFTANSDIIAFVEAGCIGPWGEWHSSSNFGATPSLAGRKAVLFALLDALPDDRMVVIRRPMFIRDIFAGGNTLTSANAYNQSKLARTGYHNDAFTTSADDLGTYADTDSLYDTRAEELVWAGNHCKYTLFGGESSCWDDNNGDGSITVADASTECHAANAIHEMETLHASYLNNGWYTGILDLWTSEGKMDEIKRRLGYRFVLKTLKYTSEVKPGGTLSIELTINNVGFASPFNPRKVELILQNGSSVYRAAVNSDPRTWYGGETVTLSKKFHIPANLPVGTYNLKLSLPDPETALYENPLYSIQFANTGVWDAATGYNTLKEGIVISNSASGETTAGNTFEEI